MSGFTILELTITMAIFSILAAIAIPNVIAWRNNAQFNGAVNTLVGDLAVAKQSAIRNNATVVINFTDSGYIIFVDDGSGTGTADNAIQEGNEQILRDRTLSGGVVIDLDATTFEDDIVQFNGTGRCDTSTVGTVAIYRGSEQSFVSVNRLGRISAI